MASRQTRKKFPLVFAPEGTVRTFDPRNEVAVHENAPAAIATENYHTGRPVPPQSNPGLRPNQRWNANASKNHVPVVGNEFRRQGTPYNLSLAHHFANNGKLENLAGIKSKFFDSDVTNNQNLYETITLGMKQHNLDYKSTMALYVKEELDTYDEEVLANITRDALDRATSLQRVAALRNSELFYLADYYEIIYELLRSKVFEKRANLKREWNAVGSVNSNRRMANREATHAALVAESERERHLAEEREIKRGREANIQREMNRQAAERRIENAERKRQQDITDAVEAKEAKERSGSTWNMMKYIPRMWGGKAKKTRKTRRNKN
jgi:hypothetical protein